MFHRNQLNSRFIIWFSLTTLAAFGFGPGPGIARGQESNASQATDAAESDSAKPDKKDETNKKKKADNTDAKRAKKKKSKNTKQRLDSIEASLQKLIKELRSLKQPTKQETKTPAANSPKPVKTPQQVAAPAKKIAPSPSMKIDSAWLKNIRWRSIGPANMGGRITDIAVADKDPSQWWIATASGGLLKTNNQGVTVEHQFDHETTVSIGAIAVAPSDPKIVWVGTGESNPRNSVSYGDGVYKSTDGGKTWKNMGLKHSFQIGRVLIHPQDANTVYVGALGRLYGANTERGVFKTADGGETWEKVLYVDERTGVIDMIMNPADPNMLIAAMWDRQRDGFDSWPGRVKRPEGIDGYDPIRKWGPGGGLYKTSDAGKSWTRLTKGLPTGMMGRIGLDWQSKSPHVIYAIIDCENIGKGPAPFAAFLGAVGTDVDGKARITQIMPKSPAEKAGVKVGDILVSVGEKKLGGFDELLEILRKKKIGEKISLNIQRGDQSKSVTAELTGRPGTRRAAPSGVWLGVTGVDRDGKVVLTRVIAGGPAEKAGLKAGDTITTLDSKKVGAYARLLEQVRKHKAGDKLKVKILRGDKKLDIALTLANRPATGQSRRPPSNVYMGIRGESADKGGAVLTDITEGGPSEKAGLKRGDIVQAIDGKKVANYQALVSVIRSHKAGDKVKVSVQRGEKTQDLELTFASRPGGPSRLRPNSYSYYGQTPNIQDMQGAKGHEYGGVYVSRDAGETWERVNSLNTRPMYFSVIRVDPSDEKHVYVMGVSQFRSDNGGKTFSGDFGRGVHADGHDLWIDPNDGRHMVTGGDGGFYITYDRGKNWDHVNTAAIGQFYHVAISPKRPYWVFGGLQDNGSWGGPAISKNGGAVNEDWISVNGGDGFVCRIDPNDTNVVYFESQNGRIGRRNLATGARASIRPQRPADGVSYRFNWNTPFILSHHNSKIFYSAGNYVFRSFDRGNNLVPISPEITLTQRGSGTALSESPRNANVLYAGTDDGALWVTRNGGHEWKNITSNLGITAPRWVATIEASRFADGRVYACLDGHRSNDDDPYVFISEDYGDTWKSLRSNLPWGSTRCLREDIENENLLYVGTEFALWASLDRGKHWTKFNNNLPTVAIHEVAIHPTNGEIVAGTHGRSLWACDVSGLRQLKPAHLASQVALHKPEPMTRWRTELRRGRTNRRYVGNNPPNGAQLWYSLPAKAKQVTMRIEDIEGRVVREIRGATDAGLHRLTWDLAQTSPRRSSSQPPQRAATSSTKPPARPTATSPPPPPQPTDKSPTKPKTKSAPDKKAPKKKQESSKVKSAPGSKANPTTSTTPRTGRPARTQPRVPPAPRRASNGSYRAILIVDGKEYPAQTLVVQRDPNLPADAISEEEYEQALIDEQRAAENKKRAKSEGRTVHFDD